jgi:hypothetical protein
MATLAGIRGKGRPRKIRALDNFCDLIDEMAAEHMRKDSAADPHLAALNEYLEIAKADGHPVDAETARKYYRRSVTANSERDARMLRDFISVDDSPDAITRVTEMWGWSCDEIVTGWRIERAKRRAQRRRKS